MSLSKACWPKDVPRNPKTRTASSRTRIHSKETPRTCSDSLSKSTKVHNGARTIFGRCAEKLICWPVDEGPSLLVVLCLPSEHHSRDASRIRGDIELDPQYASWDRLRPPIGLLLRKGLPGKRQSGNGKGYAIPPASTTSWTRSPG